MDVSIVIINYNTFQLTSDCIESVIQQTRGITYEIILVDNASAESDPSQFLVRFPNIILIRNKTNEGFAKGNNRGIEKAQGKYILLLNSDVLLKNNAVDICMRFLERENRTAGVSARLENKDGTHQCNCQRFPSIKYSLLELFRLQRILPRKLAGKILFGHFFDYESAAFPDWIWGTFFLFRKKLLDDLPAHKLYDDFFMYVEDIEWCLQFRNMGYQIAFEPEAIALHLGGQIIMDKTKLMRGNTIWFMRQHYNPLHRFFIKLLHFMLTGKYDYI